MQTVQSKWLNNDGHLCLSRPQSHLRRWIHDCHKCSLREELVHFGSDLCCTQPHVNEPRTSIMRKALPRRSKGSGGSRAGRDDHICSIFKCLMASAFSFLRRILASGLYHSLVVGGGRPQLSLDELGIPSIDPHELIVCLLLEDRPISTPQTILGDRT